MYEEAQGAQDWCGLHLQESFTAAPKASVWLQVHRISVLEKTQKKNCKRKEILEVLKIIVRLD